MSHGGISGTGDAQTGAGCAWIVVTALIVLLGLAAGTYAQSLSISDTHGLVIMDDGTMWCWGDNQYYQLGDGTFEDRLTPGPGPEFDQPVVSVAAGGLHSVVALADGTVWAWGFNWSGEVGDGSSMNEVKTPAQVSGLTDVVSVMAQTGFSMALKSDGTVWSWGSNGYGELGDGTTEQRTTPVQVKDLTDVVAIAAGFDHGLALKSDGTVWTWGNNSLGYLGDGTTVEERLTPVQVVGLDDVVAVDSYHSHRLVLKRDGTVWSWGNNLFGQLGTGEELMDSTVPVQVVDLEDVVAISAAASHSLAVTRDGSVWAWGLNLLWQLADGTTENRPSPVKVTGLTSAIGVDGGYASSYGVATDGSLWAWGSNEGHGLGDGSTSPAQVPVEILDGVALAEVEVTGRIEWVSTYAAAVGSYVTVELWCPGAEVGARVVLVAAAGAEIEASATFDSNARARAIFDLSDVPAGEYELRVINSDGTEFGGKQSFVLQAHKNVDLWVDILTRDAIRVGREQAFTVMYGNRGNADAVLVPLWIKGIPQDAEWELGFELADVELPVEGAYGDEFDYDSLPLHIEGDDEIAIPLMIPVIPPGTEGALRFIINVPTERDFELEVLVNRPYFSSPMNSAWQECLEAAGENFLLRLPPGVDCAYGISQLVEAGLEYRESSGIWSHIHFAVAWVDAAIQCSTEVTSFFPPAAAVMAAVEAVMDIPLAIYGTIKDCLEAFKKKRQGVSAVGSIDPNEKVASTGVGEGKYLSGAEPLRYVVFFENMETASAPAQEVIVTDQLDPELVDLETLQLGTMTFGEYMVEPPAGLSEYTTDVDLRPDQDLIVQIEASLDSEDGELTWRFTSIDPETGELPEDPLAGFLPPNVTPPEGDGSLMFTVETVSDLTTGTEIANEASIVFDVNDPIETGEVVNTIDIGTPTSAVEALPATQTATEFAVTWGGEDDEGGCGIETFTIYVSEDDGEPTVWQEATTETSAVYTGETGHRYSFYSRATDGVGNVEDAPADADTSTELVAAGGGGGGGGGLCGMGLLPALLTVGGGLAYVRLRRCRRP